MGNSIRKKLMLWLMVPLMTLLAVSVAFTYLLADHFARKLYDRQLLNSADSVAGRIRVRGDRVTADIPREVLDIFRHNYRDDFYYQVFSPDGLRLAGDAILPPPSQAPAVGEKAVFRRENVSGRELRVGVIRMLAPESPMGSVIIQVAETRNARRELTQQILAGIVLPQLILIVSAVVAVRVGVTKGMNPLHNITAAVARRDPGDLSPIDQGEAPEEVGPLLVSLNDLLARAREDIARQRRFASNAAHQLRTPLAGLKTYADLAKKESDPEVVKDLLKHLDGGIERMSRTVQQLLSLSKAEHAATQNAFEQVDLNIAVSDAAEEIVPESIAREVELDFLASEQPCFVQGDRVGIQELTTNLLENAVRYNHPGGRVMISVVPSGDGAIELVVEDDGIGIPEGERDRVFERFYRVTGSDLDVPGSGLGLAIVTEIARAHKASISVGEGSDGKGTRITVSFPA
ncbi:MAG: sensor histidine kinase N-terminal domain-containing protein [Candidatus Melainabacteria bacterium]|nr:sensor histidine kinase N-terminal domain-containing protein [Candidatus Melainabacteria bacterium]